MFTSFPIVLTHSQPLKRGYTCRQPPYEGEMAGPNVSLALFRGFIVYETSCIQP